MPLKRRSNIVSLNTVCHIFRVPKLDCKQKVFIHFTLNQLFRNNPKISHLAPCGLLIDIESHSRQFRLKLRRVIVFDILSSRSVLFQHINLNVARYAATCQLRNYQTSSVFKPCRSSLFDRTCYGHNSSIQCLSVNGRYDFNYSM